MKILFKIYDLINIPLFFISILLLLIYYIVEQEVLILGSILIGLIILIRYSIIKYERNIYVLFFCFILILFSSIKTLYFSEISYELLRNTLLILSQLGFALYLLKGKLGDNLLLIIFYIANAYLFFQFLRGVEASEVITWSENVVNFVVLSLVISIYLARYFRKKNIIIHPAIITLIVSFWSSGRAGIITAIIVLLLVALYKFNLKQKYLMIMGLGFALLIFTERLLKNLEEISISIATRGGTRESFFDNVRIEIWKDFFDELNIQSFLIGFNANDQHLFFGFENLHNSFLDGHFHLGIFMLIIYALLLISCVKLFVRKQFFPFILLMIFLLRGMTDTVIFTGRFDFIFIAILLYTFVFIDDVSKVKNNLSKEASN
ncbi:hypothetical protein [Marinococcus sp. PL1-022]|uniref:O-antigen ligase family protein n=1 Tax=Marinococcus sp. PL1-022 TaxID=3095363 RepID=UPI0029C1C019|nr:hypothetical protein [Marinococcus sp. PL1-022]MDX6153989.1 hypothetical protein [Marinococcus sp. PL1-022]